MEYTIFNTIFILNISRSLGQSDKLICYHAENIFSYFSFLVKQIQLSPTQSIVSTFYYIIWNFIWKLFQVEMQQVTYITIPCLSTFKHSTFKTIKRCKQIAYFEDLGNPKTAFIKSG